MKIETLLSHANLLDGVSLAELALHLKSPLPNSSRQAKGWAGQLIETYFGLKPNNFPGPDFKDLGIELKTIPITPEYKIRESTYICMVNLKPRTWVPWEKSLAYSKLKHILWVPIIWENTDNKLENQKLIWPKRVIQKPILKCLTQDEYQQLSDDYNEIMEMIQLGQANQISGRQGYWLHVRPKAANSQQLTQTIDENGELSATLPRGFYLRSLFTRKLFINNC